MTTLPDNEKKKKVRNDDSNEASMGPSPEKLIILSVGLCCRRVLQEHNAVTQTRNDGITLLREKQKGQMIFTFDKVFDERATTKQIYDFTAHKIVTLAVEGRNGSIFAYGQTSSGKT